MLRYSCALASITSGLPFIPCPSSVSVVFWAGAVWVGKAALSDENDTDALAMTFRGPALGITRTCYSGNGKEPGDVFICRTNLDPICGIHQGVGVLAQLGRGGLHSVRELLGEVLHALAVVLHHLFACSHHVYHAFSARFANLQIFRRESRVLCPPHCLEKPYLSAEQVEGLDAVGALVDHVQAVVPVHLLERVVARVTVAPENLQR